MPNTIHTQYTNPPPERDYAAEKALTRTLLNQRIGFFLLFFVITLAAAILVKTKIFFLLVLAAGTVICWVLALAIILTTKVINKISKSAGQNESDPVSIVSKLSDTISRIMIGFFLPIFCSSILTLTLLAGSFGFIDSYFVYPADIPIPTAAKIDNIKDKINDQLNGKEDKTRNHFKTIDSVITHDKQTRSDIKLKSQNSDPAKKDAAKTNKPADLGSSDSFKDEVLVPRNNMTRFVANIDTSKYKKAAAAKKAEQLKSEASKTDDKSSPKTASKYFPSVDTVIAKNNEVKLDKNEKIKEGLIIREKKTDDKSVKRPKPADTSKTKTK